MRVRAVLLAAAALGAALIGQPAHAAAAKGPDHIVVATFDTGTNPFHPCFRRPKETDPRSIVSDYPATSVPLKLTFRSTYKDSLAASKPALKAIDRDKLYHVVGTNLSYRGRPTDLVDTYPHGSMASSQIACSQFGMAPDVQLLVLNWYSDPHIEDLVDWVAAQPWIDVVHMNIQDIPAYLRDVTIQHLVAAGKMVVIAAGNGVAGEGVNYPSELSRYNGVKGTLTAGADDNGGYTSFSNLDPHVVMDGEGTVGAAPYDFGTEDFAGTSSASPRTTGYVARVLMDARIRWGHTGQGLLTIPPGRPRPLRGPLADGVLTAAELHQVVRETANPNPQDSEYDGTPGAAPYVPIPQPVDLPFAFYPKMGYGEVSEHTLPAALAVLNGTTAMPVRPMEDRFFAASELLRS